MIYAVDEIARIVRPIAQRYGLRAVYLFGSYARGAATEDSDIDLLIDPLCQKYPSAGIPCQYHQNSDNIDRIRALQHG